MRILIQHHKHGEAIFDATTPEQLGKAALYILFNNNDCGFYYDEDKPDDLDFDPAAIDTMPESLRAGAKKQVEQHKRDVRRYLEVHSFYEDVQTALAEKNGALAWELLKARRDHEYERVELETVREAPAI
jgi:hypothetical protein